MVIEIDHCEAWKFFSEELCI